MRFPFPKNFKTVFVVTSLAAIVMMASHCGNNAPVKQPAADSTPKLLYLNHSDTVHYVGMQVCRQCHENIYETFIHTGMGESFGRATPRKSVAKFGAASTIHDTYRDLWYHSFFRDSTMYMTEFRLKGKDTTFSRTEKVDYIVGSGMHTNSHMYNVNGYVFQAPMTFFAQKGKWDLPPGFENGYNSEFNRPIGLECMTCHNSFPGFVKGSENKFTDIPNGITCERCHGPGSLHVQQKMAGIIVDTSKYIDYTIVNPAKLPPDRQFDVCQRCHLQGNAVLKPGKSFYDFRPGMKLSDFMTVFMPKYKGAEDQFIMASHVERLKMSQCYIQTEARLTSHPTGNSLYPYKNALTCVTCHNPHISVRETADQHFNNACISCHSPGGKSTLTACTDTPQHLAAAGNNCVSCHMPRSGPIDIPHVTVHDHFIRIPEAKKENIIDSASRFLGLYGVNEKNPAPQIRARAYIQQFEKFQHEPYMLDSALDYLPSKTTQQLRFNFSDLVHLYFLRNDYITERTLVDRTGEKYILDSLLVNVSFDNADAWTAYRLGEAYFSLGIYPEAETFYKKAVTLAPYHPDFMNKYALSLAAQNKNDEARVEFQKALDEYPKSVQALTNLGYLWLLKGDDAKAENYYQSALSIDPDDENTLMNMAGLYIYRKKYGDALQYVDRTLQHDPNNRQALDLKTKLQQLK